MGMPSGTDMAIDPVVYVVRHEGGWALYPFRDDVAERATAKIGRLDERATLAAIANLDVSLVLTETGEDVRWAAGRTVTAADLWAMAVAA